MKIFRTVIVTIITIGVLTSMALCFGACGEKDEPEIESTEVITTVVPTTAVPTTVAPTTAKPTQKVTEPTTEAAEVVESSKDENENEVDEDEDENGSNNSADYVDDNDDVFPNNNSNNSVGSGTIYSPNEFQNAGVIDWGGYQWTYYSELILLGEGLDIPGRHTTEDGYVCDGDGYVVLAADLSMLPRYSIIDTPFGRTGKVYDTGCAYGIVDVYVGW